MPGRSFAYRARNLAGELVTGRVEAESPAAAVSLLRDKNLFVVRLDAVHPHPLRFDRLFNRKIGIRDLAVFCRQFAVMVGAGIPLLQCLRILVQQTENKRLQEILGEVAAAIEKGKGLSEAFRSHKEYFPGLLINLLAAGEVSGTVDQSLERLAAQFEKDHQLREKIKSAMTYPAMIAGMALLSVLALIILIVPVFADIFNQSGAPLPIPTRILMGISGALSSYWYLFLVGGMGLYFALRHWLATAQGQQLADRLLLRLPVVGRLITRTVVARFARTMATLLRSGVPLLLSLETVEQVVGNTVAAREIAAARTSIREGEGMAPVLAGGRVFPPMAVNLIAVGEETGALDAMLEKLAVFYEQEVEATVARLSSVIEPVLIAGVGLLVGFIAISIYLPLFGLSGAMQGGGMPGGTP